MIHRFLNFGKLSNLFMERLRNICDAGFSQTKSFKMMSVWLPLSGGQAIRFPFALRNHTTTGNLLLSGRLISTSSMPDGLDSKTLRVNICFFSTTRSRCWRSMRSREIVTSTKLAFSRLMSFFTNRMKNSKTFLIFTNRPISG